MNPYYCLWAICLLPATILTISIKFRIKSLHSSTNLDIDFQSSTSLPTSTSQLSSTTSDITSTISVTTTTEEKKKGSSGFLLFSVLMTLTLLFSKKKLRKT